MSSIVSMPPRFVRWKCPKCGTETETIERPNPWIRTCLPLFGIGRVPKCPKCGTRMVKMKLFY